MPTIRPRQKGRVHMARWMSARTFCGLRIGMAGTHCARPGQKITCARCQRGYGAEQRADAKGT